MRVGIITFHHSTNYGGTLQAYALWSIIKNQGYDVEIIDYRPYKAVKWYLRELLPINKKLQVNRHAVANLVKSWKTRRFLLSNMRLSQKKSYTRARLKDFYQHYDIVICGSDQVWCIDSPLGFRGFDPSYFLDFIGSQNSCRKISYAASFGSTVNLGIHKESVCSLISQLDAVSVRDNNSLHLVQEGCGRPATRVVDPTFLIEYSDVMTVPNIREEYLLIYNGAPMTTEEENFVKAIAKKKNLAIVSVGKYDRIADKNLIGISPSEWIGYFNKAAYVVTNTYHGTVFSLIFKKPFTVFRHAYKSIKLNDLLHHVGLEDRILSAPSSSVSLDDFFNIDYDSAYEQLEKEISKSKAYLFEALTGKQKVLNRS